MKKLLVILFLIISYWASAQTYDPTKGTVSNKPYAPAQAVPTDARTYFYDPTNFLWRMYQSKAEVLATLNLPKYRAGNFIIVIDSGGTLQSNGLYSPAGHATFWMFSDSTADANLVELNLFGGTGAIGLTNLTSTPAAGITLTITNPTTTPNITPSVALGGDLSGTSLAAATVAKFNGQPPSFYLNYANLTNTPTIPAQLNPTCVGCAISGVYPNLTWTVSASGFTTAGVDLIALSSSTVALDTLHYRKVDTLIGINDSTLNFVLNGNTYTITLRGGVHGGGGGGTGTVTTVSVVTANGVSGTVTNPTSTPAITLTLGNITPTTVNGLTLAAVAGGFTITGGSGTPHTLTVNTNNTSVAGTNTGDVTLSGENYLSIASQVITANAVNLTGTNVTGQLKAASFPALTGPVTTSGGTLTTVLNLTNANIFVGNGSNIATAVVPSGDWTITNTGVATIANNAVTYGKIQTETSQTLLGRYALTNGTVQEITLGAGISLNSSTGVLTATGTGSTNSNIGTGFRWAVPNTNNIKTLFTGYALKADSTTNTNGLTIALDSANFKDTLFVNNVPSGGSGVSLTYTTLPNTLNVKKLVAGANVTFTQNNDSSITVAASSGGVSGVTTVGAFDSQPPSTNGAVISGNTIYFQSADATHAGMTNTVAQLIAGAKTFSSAITISTLTNNGGVIFTNASGTFLQSNAGSTTQVLHGGASPSNPPSFSAVNLTTDVSNILPIANGGNGTATPTLTQGAGITLTGTWPNYTIANSTLGTVTSINVSGGSTGLTFSGGPITTTGTITEAGTLIPANGGTGLSSLSPFAVLTGGSTATGTLQQVSGTGTVNQVLTSNGPGQLPSWQNAAASSGVLVDVSQTYTSGATLTVTNGVNVLVINPSSLIASLTITLPTTWHNSNDMLIVFGGTITSGNPVISSLTIVAGSGQTLVQQSSTSGTWNAGAALRYHLVSTTDYRIN